MIARTETSISSPIMMLWLDFRVRTSIGASALSLKKSPLHPRVSFQARNPFRAQSNPIHTPIGSLAALHGEKVAEAAAQSDSDMGAAGPHGCLDRPSAR